MNGEETERRRDGETKRGRDEETKLNTFAYKKGKIRNRSLKL